MNSRNQGSLGKYVRLCSNQKSVAFVGDPVFPLHSWYKYYCLVTSLPQSLYLQISFTNDGRHEGQGGQGASFQLTSLLSCLLLALSVPHHLTRLRLCTPLPQKTPSPISVPTPCLTGSVSIATVAAVEATACLLIPWGGILTCYREIFILFWFDFFLFGEHYTDRAGAVFKGGFCTGRGPGLKSRLV